MKFPIELVPQLLKAFDVRQPQSIGMQICDGCNTVLIPTERAFCLECDPNAITFGRQSNGHDKNISYESDEYGERITQREFSELAESVMGGME